MRTAIYQGLYRFFMLKYILTACLLPFKLLAAACFLLMGYQKKMNFTLFQNDI